MLTGITLENFKAFKEPQFIPIKPITLIFGPNSSGKSSIIHAMAFIKHVHDTQGNCDPGRMEYGWSTLNLGSWSDLVYGNNEEATMRITLHNGEDAIQWSFEKVEDAAKVTSFLITENGCEVARGTNVGSETITWQTELHSKHKLWKASGIAMWKKISEHFGELLFETESGKGNYPEEKITRMQETFTEYFTEAVADEWESPNRCRPEREYYADDTPFRGLFPSQKIDSLSTCKSRAKELADMSFTFEWIDWRSTFEHGDTEDVPQPAKDEYSMVESICSSLKKGTDLDQDQKNSLSHLCHFGYYSMVTDLLNVAQIMRNFTSHLHLDAQRFPSSSELSSRALSKERPEDRPWLALLDPDSEHYYYSSFKAGLQLFQQMHSNPIPDELEQDILNAVQNHKLQKYWPTFAEELKSLDLDKQYLYNLFDNVFAELFQQIESKTDLPPRYHVNAGLKQLGISHRMETREHVKLTFPPGVSPGKDGKIINESYSVAHKSKYTEIVFKSASGVHTIHNLGSGTRVILPVIVSLTTSDSALLSIEEPECHIHPKLQADLGDIIIKRSASTFYSGNGFIYGLTDDDDDLFARLRAPGRFDDNARHKSHTIIETHSEHLILRILRRIRETTEEDLETWPEPLLKACPEGLSPKDVSVVYAEPGDDGTTLSQLRINELGEFIDEWPGGFFDERIKEVL